MLGSLSSLHATAVSSLVVEGPRDCVLVSSCGGRLATHGLLLALNSPLLAPLLGQGEGGVSLPLSLPATRDLVRFLQSRGRQGEARHLKQGVHEEVVDGLALLGISVSIEDIKPELPTNLRSPGNGQVWKDYNEVEPIQHVQHIKDEMILAEESAIKQEVVVQEDVKNLLMMKLDVKETSLDVPEDKMKVNKSTKEVFVESITHIEESKVMSRSTFYRTEYKANVLSRLEKVCKCDLDELSDHQKIKHYKAMHKKCPNCRNLYNVLSNEAHVCKSQKTVTKDIPSCTVCGKKSHKADYHSTIPENCDKCGNSFRNKYFKDAHSYGCGMVEVPFLIC